MHAYLLLGRDSKSLDEEAASLSQTTNAALMEFPLSKIEDVRELSRVVTLSLSRTTFIYIRGIDMASIEAQNAFLKLLEEPQERLNFILTAGSFTNVLPTISSRCQIIRLKTLKKEVSEESENFSKMSLEQKMVFIESIKGRDKALNFVEEVIENWHLTLLRGDSNSIKNANNLKRGLTTLSALKANGNILLQLTNFVISLE